MTDLVQLLRDRKITGLNSSDDPKSYSLEVSETSDPLCIAAADEIERLRAALLYVVEDVGLEPRATSAARSVCRKALLGEK